MRKTTLVLLLISFIALNAHADVADCTGKTVVVKRESFDPLAIGKDINKIYILYQGGLVVDKTQRLMWKRCPEGMVFDIDECIGRAEMFTWQNAIEKFATKKVEYASYKGWRLPDISEIESILDKCQSPTLNHTVFPLSTGYYVWASNDDPGFYDDKTAWYAHTGIGTVGMMNKLRQGVAFLVRDLSQFEQL